MVESLAGLLTSAVVGIAKAKLAAAIAEQANLLWDFGDDLEDMKEVLESISAALQDAEKRSAKEELVQLWLKRLKHASIDISDLLEDYQDTSESLTAKAPGVLSCLLSCLPIALMNISVAIRMKSMRKELRKIKEDIRDFNFTQGSTCTSVEQHDDDRETTAVLPEEPIGRNREKQEVMKLLSARANNDETAIVPIYGLGGIGKTTLAQLVYKDAKKFKSYDHPPVWVYVSRNFSLKKIGSSIISQLPIEGGQQNLDSLHMITECLDNKWEEKDKKVLIVLDDLWEEKDTELGKLRSMLHVGKKGSMIDVIVTTRNEDIARKVSTSEPYKLQPLKDHMCWEIIKICSKFEQQHNQERLERIGRDIAKKCGGVPLAAQALGHMLQPPKNLDEWTAVNNSDIWNEPSEDNDRVLPSLKLSYERMHPQLRICFSYCAIFPKGHNIAEDDLIHQWIALDFIKPSKGKEYIRQLLGMSFLQVSKLPKTWGDHMERYTMHDLVHHLATLIMGNELIAHSQKYCRYASVTKYDHTTRLSNVLPAKVRALHFSDSGKLDLSCGAFSFAKCLRILDFSGCSGILFPASIGQLKQLKYLTAPRMQNEVLPEYVTELSKLQYLNLNGSSHISALPEIGKLRSLRYLGLSGCSRISKLPESIGDLKCMVHLDISGCSGIRELPASLCNLTNLRHLDLSGCSGQKGLGAALHGLTALQYMDISNVGHMPYQCMEADLHVAMRSLTNLKILKLESSLFGLFGNHMHTYLNFIGALTNLEYLDLSRNFDLYNLPESIGNLKRLHTLNLDGCPRKLIDQASHLLHYSLTLPLFKIRADDVSTRSNLHLLEGENVDELHIVSLENVRFVEEAQRLELTTKQNLLSLKLAWTPGADRHLEDNDLLGQLVPPMSLKDLSLEGYSSPSFPRWLMDISQHLPNLTCIELMFLPQCTILPPLGQLPYLESLCLRSSPSVTKLDGGICGGKGAFPRLAKFEVSFMDGLEEWNTRYSGEDGVDEFMFPMLDVLKVSYCPRLGLKPCPLKCRLWTISESDQVISSLEEEQTSRRRCNSTPTTTSLTISRASQYHSFRMFHHFPALQQLKFFMCPNLTSLPEGIKQLSSLQSLELEECQSISALPEWLSDNSSLKRLVIKDCWSIKSLPACIQQLTNLEQLDIYENDNLKQWCELEENKAKLAYINIMYRDKAFRVL